jgi:NADPH-dependent 2,4-dienoyl-CoA reductase/sulfur reductase-like enzyme
VVARGGMVVTRQPLGEAPPSPGPAGHQESAATSVRHLFADVVVIGQGEAGEAAARAAREAGREVDCARCAAG